MTNVNQIMAAANAQRVARGMGGPGFLGPPISGGGQMSGAAPAGFSYGQLMGSAGRPVEQWDNASLVKMAGLGNNTGEWSGSGGVDSGVGPVGGGMAGDTAPNDWQALPAPLQRLPASMQQPAGNQPPWMQNPALHGYRRMLGIRHGGLL